MPAEPLRAQTVLQEGLLGRKHSAEGSGKKSSNRSARTRSANHGTGADPASSSPQVVEQPLLRPETGPALGLQGRQELGPGGHLPRRGAPEPGQRQLGDPQQLQEEEARLQAAVSHAHVCRHAGAGGRVASLRPHTHATFCSVCSLGDASEYLFQCKDEVSSSTTVFFSDLLDHSPARLSFTNVSGFNRPQEELQRWGQAMQEAMQEAVPQPSAQAKAHTLPVPPTSSPAPPEPSSSRKEKEKKFGRFAKKK